MGRFDHADAGAAKAKYMSQPDPHRAACSVHVCQDSTEIRRVDRAFPEIAEAGVRFHEARSRRAFSPAEKAFRRGDDNAAIEHFGRGVLGNF